MVLENKALASFLKTFSYCRLNKLAVSCGFIERKRRLRAVDLVRICAFWSGKTSYPTLTEILGELRKSRVILTRQSLDARFNPKAAAFLKKLAMELLRVKANGKMDMDWAAGFGRILLLDSTIETLFDKCRKKYRGFGGGASRSAVKVQHCFDLLSGNILTLLPQSGRKTDAAFGLRGIRRGDLFLFDLAYANYRNLLRVIGKEAFFLCRLKFNSNVYVLKKGKYERIDLLRLISRMKEGDCMDVGVFLGARQKVPVRMILHKIPEGIARSNARKLKSDKQQKRKGITKQRLAFCRANAYITNLDAEKLPPDSARRVYSLRWQVEIVFKCWKSGFSLKQVPDIKIERFECFFYGCLIRIIVTTRFFWMIKTRVWNKARIEISEIKAYKLMRNRIEQLKMALIERQISLIRFTREIWYLFTQSAVKSRKKGRQLPTQIMNMPG